MFGSRKKRYQIKCISEVDVMIREMRLTGLVLETDTIENERESGREKVESMGLL